MCPFPLRTRSGSTWSLHLWMASGETFRGFFERGPFLKFESGPCCDDPYLIVVAHFMIITALSYTIRPFARQPFLKTCGAAKRRFCGHNCVRKAVHCLYIRHEQTCGFHSTWKGDVFSHRFSWSGRADDGLVSSALLSPGGGYEAEVTL